MTEEEALNVSIMRDAYAQWDGSKGGSVAHLMSLMADDIRWCSLGNGGAGQEFTAACIGKQDVPRYFEQLGAQWQLLGYEADEYVAQGDRVVMLGSCHWRHRGTGKEVHSPKADVLHFRAGKIVKFMEFYDTAQVAAASQP